MTLSPDATLEEMRSELETLKAKHAELDQQVTALDERVWLSPEEQVERKNMQKMKLKLKDQMQSLKERISKA